MGGKGSGRDAEGMKHARSKQAAHPVALDPDHNALIMQYLVDLGALPQIDRSDAEQVRERVRDWFEMLEVRGLKPQVNGLALALGVDRRRLLEIVANGRGCGLTPEGARVVKMAYELIAVFNENALLEAQGNPAGLIFLAKNHHGYTDMTQVLHTSQRLDVAALPPDQVAERYRLQAGESMPEA